MNIETIDLRNTDKDIIAVILPQNYEVKQNDVDKLIITREPIQYPKDVAECRDVVNKVNSKKHTQYVLAIATMLDSFETLMMCRGAYWSIANDWRPFWKDAFQERYSIVCDSHGNLQKVHYVNRPTTFVFPTGEMRDAFFENFEYLLNQCRELVI